MTSNSIPSTSNGYSKNTSLYLQTTLPLHLVIANHQQTNKPFSPPTNPLNPCAKRKTKNKRETLAGLPHLRQAKDYFKTNLPLQFLTINPSVSPLNNPSCTPYNIPHIFFSFIFSKQTFFTSLKPNTACPGHSTPIFFFSLFFECNGQLLLSRQEQ